MRTGLGLRWTTLPGKASASFPAHTFGLHPGATTKACADDLSAQIGGTRRLHDAGVCWRQIETAPGVYSWAALDGHLARAAGCEVIYTVWGTPRFYSARPDEIGAYGPNWPGASAEPKEWSALAAFVRALVAHAAGRITVLEPLNEPAFDSAGKSTSGMFTGWATDAAQWVRIVKQSGGLRTSSPPVPHAGTTYSFKTMMNASDGAGGRMAQWCDLVTFHAYGNTTPDPTAAYNAMRSAANAVGLTAAELWDTESNFSSDKAATWTDAQGLAWEKRSDVLFLWAGVKRRCFYGWDQGPFGIKARPGLQNSRNDWHRWLMASGLQDVAKDSAGRVRFVSGSLVQIV